MLRGLEGNPGKDVLGFPSVVHPAMESAEVWTPKYHPDDLRFLGWSSDNCMVEPVYLHQEKTVEPRLSGSGERLPLLGIIIGSRLTIHMVWVSVSVHLLGEGGDP